MRLYMMFVTAVFFISYKTEMAKEQKSIYSHFASFR